MHQINMQFWLVCEPVISCGHILTLSKRLKVLISTLLSSSIIHNFIQLIPCGLNGQVSHSSLEKAVLHLLQVSAGGRRHVYRCHWPVHALAPQLAWLNTHAGLTFWMCGGAQKHHERWRGFVKEWQNSISQVQSGWEKPDPSLSKTNIKNWRLWKLAYCQKICADSALIISGDCRPTLSHTLSHVTKVLPNSDWYLFPF